MSGMLRYIYYGIYWGMMGDKICTMSEYVMMRKISVRLWKK